MTFVQELVVSALKDEYLKRLLKKAEIIYGMSFLKKQGFETLNDKEVNDLIRFADILSRDTDSTGRGLAYKIVSLLYPCYKNDDYFIFVTNSILTKLGNFPSLNLILENKFNDNYDTIEVALEKSIKEEFQKVPGTNKVFSNSYKQEN